MGNYISFNKNNENINLNQVPYNCLTNFENVTEKACIKADKQNDKIYKKLLESVKSAEKHVKDTGLYFNLEVPLPPHPSNRDKFLLWQKRNVNHHVITQSEAVVFLEQNGFKLNIDYEPYQAIELSKEIKKQKGIPINNDEILQSKNFDNVYTNNDTNIFRRRSMYGRNQFLETRDRFKENTEMIHKNLTQDNINLHNASENSQDSYLSLNRSTNMSIITSNPSVSPAPSAPPPPNNQGDTNKNNSIYPSI